MSSAQYQAKDIEILSGLEPVQRVAAEQHAPAHAAAVGRRVAAEIAEVETALQGDATLHARQSIGARGAAPRLRGAAYPAAVPWSRARLATETPP